MAAAAEMAMFKLFTILFLGARPFAPAQPGVPLRLCAGRETPIYAEANVAALRRTGSLLRRPGLHSSMTERGRFVQTTLYAFAL